MKSTMTLLALASVAGHAVANHNPPKQLDTVIVNGGRPTSLPTQIPTTIEGVTGEQVEDRINASDAEDALKYLPSLNVRKRYIGDYDHAVLASRASGTGNSARSLVYADGILLSNLLGNGATFTPRWGLVSPEEIERVDVLYGPFSAAYPGNAVGAVVDYQTRMPSKLEAHVKLLASTQNFQQYASSGRYSGKQGSASIGDRQGAWSWWLDLSRLDSHSQPISFGNRLVSTGVVSTAGLPVTGYIVDKNPSNKDWLIIGSTSATHTVQDHAKAKLAFDVSPTLRASYTLGWWQNDSVRSSESYLRDAAGNPVYRGDANNFINMGGRRYEWKASDLAPSTGDLEHVMQGLSVKTHSGGRVDWEVAVSRYDYVRDQVRTPTVPVPGPTTAGQGNVTDMGGSGWNTLALKGTLRPGSAHVVDVGVQRDSAMLRTHVFSGDWLTASTGKTVSDFNGNTRLSSLYAQDTWRIDAAWKATFGARLEQWQAYGGELGNATVKKAFGTRTENSWSPKAALAVHLDEAWMLKASLGRAVRNPTAAELFQGSIIDGAIVNSDPNLRAERSWTSELTAERVSDSGLLRATVFHETTRDALYSQPLTATVNTIQNVDRIRTNGLELAWQDDDVFVHGFSLSASGTYADSIITANARFPGSVGRWQPRVPRWRGTMLASYHAGQHWTTSLGARYSGKQFGTLDNSDPNGATYTGLTKYFVLDARVRYQLDKQWSAALGIDNLANEKYWAFHPYPMRAVVAELRYDL